jgi:acyl-CoA thioester hydrolase
VAVSAPLTDAGPTDRVPPFRFSVRTRVDFSDTDAAGIVYYGRYPPFFDRAIMAYRRHLGLGLLGEPGHLVVMRSLRVEYHAAARFDDPLEVLVRVARLGRTSHTLALRVEHVGGAEPRHLADGELVTVGVEAYGGPATPVPEEWRRRIVDFEGEALEIA